MLITDGTDGTARDIVVPAGEGLALRGRFWMRPMPRGVVVVAHGFGEHGGRYRSLADTIGPAAGVDVLAADFRGHGRSPGRRGVVRDYDDLTSDFIAAFDYAGRERPGLPRFVLGHSNGGQVALRAALDPRIGPQIAGLILSNPSLRLALTVPGHLLQIGRFLRRFAPGITLGAGMRTEMLTRDLEMRKVLDADPLSHGRISAPLFFGMVEGGAALLNRVGEVRTPLLVILGGSDPIVDPNATRAAFDRFGSDDRTLRLYPGMLHEPFNEVGREQVFADLIAWLDDRLPPPPL